MRVNLIRMFADWWKDADDGINAELANVPRDADMPVPQLIPIDGNGDIAVYDVTRHPWVLQRGDPPALPCIYVMTEGAVDVSGEVPTDSYRETNAPGAFIVARYLAARDADVVVASLQAELTLLAALRSARRLMDQVNDAARTRNNTLLVSITDGSFVPVTEAVGASQVTGALVLGLYARDAAF